MSDGGDTGLADRVIEGQRYLLTMRTSEGLRAAAAQLAERVDQLGCGELFAASAQADAVVAVAVALNDNLNAVTLGQITSGRLEKVVVVEAVAVSGMKVRRAVEAVREAGAHWVAVVVLKDLYNGTATNLTQRFGAVEELRTGG